VTSPLHLAALTQLTGAAFAAQQARMGALQQAAQELRDKLAALDTLRKARAAALTEPDPALQAGADVLWQSWIEQRRAALNAALARNLVAQATARVALAQAFGRNQVTEALARRAAQNRVRQKARRADDLT
jgi:hypothetical protein